jgi:hypothetical protein
VARAPKIGTSSWTLREHYNRFRVFSEGPYGQESQLVVATQESQDIVAMAQDRDEFAAVCQDETELLSSIQLPDD